MLGRRGRDTPGGPKGRLLECYSRRVAEAKRDIDVTAAEMTHDQACHLDRGLRAGNDAPSPAFHKRSSHCRSRRLR